MDIIIKPLSPKLIDDYLYFFDNMLFTENPDWSKCYCYSYHFTGPKEAWGKERNRAAVIDLIGEGKMRGYLAFVGEKPVGWCNANDKKSYQSFKDTQASHSKICSIVCFLISPDHRRNGIAQKILEQVINDYTSKGYDHIEAYPRKDKHSCERNYHGHLSLYEKFNFNASKEFDDHFVVIKKLQE